MKERIREQQERAEQLQKQGKYIQAMQIFEEVFALKKNTFGENDLEYFKTSYKICDICNLIAMIFLQKEKYDLTLDMLKKAEKFSMNSGSQLAATYNNLACYFRKINKLRVSLDYLRKALKLQLSLSSVKGLSDTHLNLCAVLSQLGKHTEALQQVLMSVIYLQDQLLVKSEASQDRLAVLAIAYHNMGVQLQYLKRKEQAILAYRKAVEFAESKLGKENNLVQNLKNILSAAEDSISNEKKSKKRPETRQRIEKLKETYKNFDEERRKPVSRGN